MRRSTGTPREVHKLPLRDAPGVPSSCSQPDEISQCQDLLALVSTGLDLNGGAQPVCPGLIRTPRLLGRATPTKA
jgi:hypothetical protein